MLQFKPLLNILMFLSQQIECMKNIMKDLAHYNTVIQSYCNLSLRKPDKEVPLLNSTLAIIKNLREVCLVCSCVGGVKTQRQKIRVMV